METERKRWESLCCLLPWMSTTREAMALSGEQLSVKPRCPASELQKKEQVVNQTEHNKMQYN
ncbi:hypothetical protein STEG23_007536 [Scotinomys teguina]